MAHGSDIVRSIGLQSNLPLLNFFNSSLNQQQSRDINQQTLEQRQQESPFKNQLLQLQTELAQAQQPSQLIAAEEAASPLSQLNRRETARLQSIVQGAQTLAPFLENNDISGARKNLLARKQRLTDLGLPTETTDESLEMLDSNPELLLQRTNQALALGRQAGFIKLAPTSVSQREFDDNVASVEADPELKTIRGQAASRALGLTAKASLTKEERIANDRDLASRVAENKGQQAEATETGKSKAQLKFKPSITRAVKLAQKEASERGEVLTDLARMEASLPGVREAVNQLIELSNVATSTLGGRAFDFLVKESGFGSTRGADARAKLIAIVDNQVLPLLKETFGAAFTVQEGENLKASLVNPDASPSQKREQLDAFLAQKERNIRTKQTQLNLPSTSNAGVPDGTGIDIGTASIEELIAERKRLGGQ